MPQISTKDDCSSIPGTRPIVERVLPLGKPGNGAGPTILVVDDNEDTRAMLETLLTHKGYRVVEAADGEQAIEATSRENPGLVLLDLGLPRMNGLSVIRHLRNELRMSNVPVVVITGYDKHLNTAVAAGCDDYLLKPIDFARLDAILEYYVPNKASATSA